MKLAKIAIVGQPNVGKSSIFNNLSSRYATVSNYPGTTVELFKATTYIKDKKIQIIDTPGMYSFLPLSEEEKIARLILIKHRPDIVIHVVSASNLERMLPLTFQLIEAGLTVILVLNIMDEAKKEGLDIDVEKLEEILGIPVVATVSVRTEGIKTLKKRILQLLESREKSSLSFKIKYPVVVEKALETIILYLKSNYLLSKRLLGLLLLQGDDEIRELVREKEVDFVEIERICLQTKEKISQPLEYLVNLTLRNKTAEITRKVMKERVIKSANIARFLGNLTLKPLVGVPLLLAFLYFGIYKLVGEFGAGTLVDFLESKVFEAHVNPFFISLFKKLMPWEIINSLFVGEYGIITLGIRYAVAIIFPIVGIFFFVFSFAEDTGYLPRVGAMLDRLFKKIGLSGKAVIPIILGLGCDTMATMVTRILPTKRERIIATLLLSLSVPCSAQLGVIMAVLSSRRWALLLWFLIISMVFSLSGFLLNHILKGKRPSFHIELPPLRLPRISNIFTKTYVRLKWYFKEVLPLFIWASLIIWLGQITKVFDWVISFLSYPVKLMGLPVDMSKIFLFGFFRRDYGAAGLYDLDRQGILSFREILVASVVLTLFLPCIAQFLMNIKERGIKVALAIAMFILLFSFSTGVILNKILVGIGIQ
ncbi:MAG: ferrous iron transport protein B [Candidatus Omnitrophica bacterium]|jgi:ferrous iron transport protein B|nr:ferrous iron transport protein B [Candidatus Omnitrophota bacterium]